MLTNKLTHHKYPVLRQENYKSIFVEGIPGGEYEILVYTYHRVSNTP